MEEILFKPMPSNATQLRRARRGCEGLTLVELMIVVALLAVIGTAVTVALGPFLDGGKEKVAVADCQAIRQVAILWRSTNSGLCPSVPQLASLLDQQSRSNDPWGHAYTVRCEEGEIKVLSAGADGAFGTDDDIDGRLKSKQSS